MQIAERWILARLRHETFLSVGALNARIAELLTELNARRMRRYGASRRLGPRPRADQERRDLLGILEDRYGSRSTSVTSQLPPGQWHDHLGEPTLADAIRDRLLHNAHRIVLKGPSRRKTGKLDS